MSDEPTPNPYAWQGDHLIHVPSSTVIGSVVDFPQLVRMRALHWPDKHKLIEGITDEGGKQ